MVLSKMLLKTAWYYLIINVLFVRKIIVLIKTTIVNKDTL